MKTETKAAAKKTGIWFKLFTIIIIVMASVFAYIKFEKFEVISFLEPEEKAHIMDVQIENQVNIPSTENNEQLELLEKELNDRISIEAPENSSIKTFPLEKVDHYRVFLTQVMRLIEKFSRNVNYSNEIDYLHTKHDIYPSEIAAIIASLKDYKNKYLTLEDTEYKKVNIEGNFVIKIFNKIVHIEQKNPNYEARIAEHNKLKNTLYILEDYFYSKEFLTKHFSND